MGELKFQLNSVNYPTILVIIASFVLPVMILFDVDPDSFQLVWEARTPYILFVLFFGLELVLSLGKFKRRLTFGKKTLLILVVMAAPTVYVVSTFFWGLNYAVVELGKIVGVPYVLFGKWFIDVSWPISLEYFVFAASFTLTIFLVYGKYGLKRLLISIFFIWSTTVFFMLNTFAPYGIIGVLQAFVPFTTASAARVLELLGFKALVGEVINERGPGMMLTVMSETSAFTAMVYWPSAGIQSLVIYTGMILLFVKDAPFTVMQKIIYFAIGAVGTFAANICRIVSISIIGLKVGLLGANIFHDYYGEFFFIGWMIIYLALIVYRLSVINRTKRR